MAAIHVGRRGAGAAVLASCAIAVGAALAPALAHDYAHGALHIEHPWTRATTPTAPTAAVYMGIENRGDADDRLTGAETPAADRVEIHDMTIDADGVMRMRESESGVALPSGGIVALKSGGIHLMLFGLETGLTQGETFPLTLTFEGAESLTVDVHVESIRGPEGDERNHEHE